MRQPNRLLPFAASISLLILALFAVAHAQVAVYQTHFPSVTMPSQIGQQALLGALPLGTSTQAGLASFDVQATGSFQGVWFSQGPNVQESFDIYLCDAADCSGSTRARVGHVVLAPVGISNCLDGVLTLRGSFAQASGGVHDAIYTGMLEGLWTGRPKLGSIGCAPYLSAWGDGMIDGIGGEFVTGPIGALPSLSKDPVDTTSSLFLVLTTTLIKNENGAQGIGQMSLMRAVVYPQ